jgi:hypothetical protein
MNDDLEARRRRAERLHRQIAGIAGEREADPEAGEAEGAAPPDCRPESPREFVHRRMRELDADETD